MMLFQLQHPVAKDNFVKGSEKLRTFELRTVSSNFLRFLSDLLEDFGRQVHLRCFRIFCKIKFFQN